MDYTITTVFDEDSPELQPYLDRNKVDGTFKGPTKTWRIVKVTVDREYAPNPFTGKIQTKVDLLLDDGQPAPASGPIEST